MWIGFSRAWRAMVAAVAVSALLAGAAEGQKPVNLVVADQAASGSLKRTGDGGLRLRLDTGEEKLGLRSVGEVGLPGDEALTYRQKLPAYFSTWRKTFEGEERRAVVVVPGAGKDDSISLKLSHPRFNRNTGIAIFDARRVGRPSSVLAEYRRRVMPDPPRTFGPVKVKIHDNGWYPLWAHLNAYGDYGRCSDGYEGPSFTCQAKGEAGNTSPWDIYGHFGSTEGGVKFTLSGHITVPWETMMTVYMSADLKGTQAWGWRGDQLTINDQSRYKSTLGSIAVCTRTPVSGTDPALTGSPGGPLHVKLSSASSFTQGQYVLDLNGFLSEGFPIPKQCRH